MVEAHPAKATTLSSAKEVERSQVIAARHRSSAVNATLVVTSSGQVTISDAQGNTIVQATLTPVADASYLYGSAGELQDPCYGVFTFRVATASAQ